MLLVLARRPLFQTLFMTAVLLSYGGISGSLVSAAESAPASKTSSPASSGVWVTSIASLGGGQFVAATADGLLLRESSVCSFSAKHPEQLEAIYSHPAGVWAVAVANDGKRIASSDYRGNLGIYTVAGGESKIHEGVLERWSQALAFAPDNVSIVAGNEAGKLFLFDVAAGKVSKSLELGPQAIAGLAFSPNGKLIAATDGSGTVHLVSWPEFAVTGKIKISEEAAWGVKFADDNTLVVGSSDRNLYRCAATADAKPESILSGRDWITHIAISSSGQIAAAELGGTIHVTTIAGGGSQLTAPSSVWAVGWNGPSELFVGTRKNGVVIAAQSWTLTERAADPPPKAEVKAEPKPEAKPADAKPAETKPAEAKPAEAKPAAAKPAVAKPAAAKPAEAKPAEAKPVETKPAEAKPAEAKPAEAKPAEAEPAEAKPAEAKPAAAKPAEAKPAADTPAPEAKKESKDE